MLKNIDLWVGNVSRRSLKHKKGIKPVVYSYGVFCFVQTQALGLRTDLFFKEFYSFSALFRLILIFFFVPQGFIFGISYFELVVSLPRYHAKIISWKTPLTFPK